MKLLEWSWSASHTAIEVDGLKGDSLQAALADMGRLVYISRACLRLLRTYVNEVYPDGGETGVTTDVRSARTVREKWYN